MGESQDEEECIVRCTRVPKDYMRFDLSIKSEGSIRVTVVVHGEESGLIRLASFDQLKVAKFLAERNGYKLVEVPSECVQMRLLWRYVRRAWGHDQT